MIRQSRERFTLGYLSTCFDPFVCATQHDIGNAARRNLFRHIICILSYIVCESGADWRNSEEGHVTLPLCQSMCLKFWLCSLENPFAVLVVVDSILLTSFIHSSCWRKETLSQHERGSLEGPSRFASNLWYLRYPSVVMPLKISHEFTRNLANLSDLSLYNPVHRQLVVSHEKFSCPKDFEGIIICPPTTKPLSCTLSSNLMQLSSSSQWKWTRNKNVN